MEKEYGEVHEVPCEDQTLLASSPFSDMVELDEKTEVEYVDFSVVSDEGLAILVDPSV